MSEVKVNKISPRTNCGTTTLGDSGDTFNIPSGSKINVASGGNITVACGATITNNGTQTGFGRTGTVDWQTTPKTGNFTAANGEGYFINTTSSAITMTMPSGSAGAIVSIQDYNKTFDSNALTVAPASGEKINGGTASGSLLISTEGQGLTFVYVDGTVGWKTVHENEFTSGGSTEIVATGGTITTSGNYRIHTFTSPGTFCISQISATPANNTVSYLVVAGGGAGGAKKGGGGGAGGFREYKGPADCYTASPLNGNPGGTAITVTAQAYPITVGGGGSGTPQCAPAVNNGTNSVFSTITSAGGGGGGATGSPGGAQAPNNPQPGNGAGNDGGSGGGVSDMRTDTAYKGAGNTPPVSPPQGNPGGMGVDFPPSGAGGGGGASASGANATTPGTGPSPSNKGGNGGAGVATSITGSPVTRAGGGGGGINPGGSGAGTGGSGGGGNGDVCGPGPAGNGTVNTGGGGGGGGAGQSCNAGGNGGSGVVIIRYKFQN